VKDPVATPLVSCKRGRLLGSRNKKTLAALVAAAAADSTGASPAATVVVTPAGAVAAAVTPVEAAVGIVGATVSVGATPPGFAAMGAGGSASAATNVVRKPQRPPAQQRLSYTSEHGFTTFLVHFWAGCKVCLPLPFRFVDTLGGTP
jgi:hypothetical protein